MLRYGFIRTKDEIKFLILLCMEHFHEPISFEDLIDVCTWCDDGFSYFELCEAFQELQESQHVVPEEDGRFALTEKGHQTSAAFHRSLPLTVREAAEASALRVIRKHRRDAAVHSAIAKIDENEYTVTLTMDGVFSLRMSVVSTQQATLLERNFKKHAEKIYDRVLDAMLSDYEETET